MKELMVVEGQGPKKMTSLEIAELVESRHDNVRTTIERLAGRAVIELPAMQEISTATKPVKVYLLDKRSSLIVVAQLSPEFTARVVDRWQELEQANQSAYILPQNYKEALLQLVSQVEQNEQLQITLAEQAPKVEFAEAVSASSKSIKVGDFVKAISSQTGFVIGRNNFYEWLRFDRIVNRSNMPFQEFIDNGWFEVRESTYENKNTNGPQVCFTTLVTGKGQVALLNRFKKSSTFQKYLNKAASANKAGQIEATA